VLAIVPARGGSKGLPGKNVRPLCGKPLIAHTIEAAKGSRSITRVVVSTDDEEIAAVTRAHGGEIPFLRPAELATDTSPAIDTYVYTADRLGAEELVVLLPTAPLRTSADIDAAVDLFKAKKADSVISYYEAPHPVHWHKYLDAQGRPEDVIAGAALANRQEVRPAYLPNGAIYVFRMALLKEKRTYHSDRTYAYVMPRERSVDIDTLDDFELAELLMKRRA
jgi:N-acylneuraminate cytidylyltransferase/CMP-N,N'-diacetyllegionaminic acid synthase